LPERKKDLLIKEIIEKFQIKTIPRGTMITEENKEPRYVLILIKG
jgi:hypothetical protein